MASIAAVIQQIVSIRPSVPSLPFLLDQAGLILKLYQTWQNQDLVGFAPEAHRDSWRGVPQSDGDCFLCTFVCAVAAEV